MAGLGCRLWLTVGVMVLGGCGNNKGHAAFIDESGGKKGAGAPAVGAAQQGGDGGKNLDSTLDDALDPKKLYLLGTLMEGSCDYWALAPVSNPNKYDVGFTCALLVGNLFIRKNTLLYTLDNPAGVYEFHPDPNGHSIATYPRNPLANDVAIKTPCPRGGLVQYLVSPSGRLIYECAGAGWFDEGGTAVYDGNEGIFALGDGDMVVTTDGVMNLKDGVTVAVPEITDRYAIRAHGSSFHVAVQGADQPVLWSVDASGTPKKLGQYPAAPDGVNLNGSSAPPYLTNDDSLVMSATDTTKGNADVFFSRTVDGTSQIIYTEADNPVVRIHEAALVQGF